MSMKWEYVTLVVDFDVVQEINGESVSHLKINFYKKMAELGQESWELVSVSHYGGMKNILMAFKRPI